MRTPTPKERSEIAKVIAVLSKALGVLMPEVKGYVIRDGEKSGFAARAVRHEGDYYIIVSKEMFDAITGVSIF